MAKHSPIDASRARLKVIVREVAALDREREILERFMIEYQGLAFEPVSRAATLTVSHRRRRRTVPAVARFILEKTGHPLPARELVTRLAERKKVIGGKDPVTNLSSVLSPHEDFVSVPWGKTRAWWLSDREVPPEPSDSGDGRDDAASPPTLDLKGGDDDGAALAS